ncbi:NADPH-dependent oxidoreductase [Boudabousia tangfeifanii]|uniref:NADPH-dependent oxidoreductase n=1 Tax=Boudabousia tangfeifanii TaxID=1912795 RepID=A0A1D9MMT5_9ACTO|nr:nitroreductase family protein [Boudabousia tangfeifanii]AOZ73460.1 NADPH-dependent oxidoreductase [Boudabousia tangfeifanii]
MMNPMIEAQLAHRSIRAYSQSKLTAEQLKTLLTVARHGATSAYQQQTTIIHVTDPKVREQIYQASGQPYVGGDRGELFLFIADLYRNAKIREEAGVDIEDLARMNLFLQACQDTLIAAQNMVAAAESLGLGTVYLGSITADPRLVIEALKLPRLTYPLVGLLVGEPEQSPQFKPRLPQSIVVSENAYPDFENFHEALAEYDAVVQQYYDLRDTTKTIGTFTSRIEKLLGKGAADQSPVLEILHEQGLGLK